MGGWSGEREREAIKAGKWGEGRWGWLWVGLGGLAEGRSFHTCGAFAFVSTLCVFAFLSVADPSRKLPETLSRKAKSGLQKRHPSKAGESENPWSSYVTDVLS